MGKLNDSNVSPARRRWRNVFNSMRRVLQTQHSRLEFLVRERKLLADRIQFQHNQFKDQISEMRNEISILEEARTLEAARSDLMLGGKQIEAFVHKFKLDNALSELADFIVWFDYLSRKCNETKENSPKITALLSEKTFVWNQYKKRESELTDQLKSKSSELEQANERIQSLIIGMEGLQTLNDEKDAMLLNLKTNMTELEAASLKKSEEVSRLSKELELLQRKAGSDNVTPVLRRCSKNSRLRARNGDTDARNVTAKNDEKNAMILNLKTNMAELEAASLKKREEVSRLSKELELLRRKAGSDNNVTPVLRHCSKDSRLRARDGDTDARNVTAKNEEKDAMILNLKTNMAELEAASLKKSEEVCRLSKELELLQRKAGSDNVTPVLRRCSIRARNGDTDARNVIPKKESHPSRVPEKGGRSSKRKKAADADPVSEISQLFTSRFKVPKLKNLSPRLTKNLSNHCFDAFI